MHLWHKCLVMTKLPVEVLVKVIKLTNWIIDSVATCHMTPQVLCFIPGSLEDKDKHIEVLDVHHATENQKE